MHGSIGVDAPGLIGNDYDPDGGTPYLAVPSNGSTATTPHGWLTGWANGSFTYTAAHGYVGTDSYTYTVCDGQGGCTSGTVTFNITNQPPNLGSDNHTVHGLINVPAPGLLGNDSDPDGDTLIYSSTNGGVASLEHGWLKTWADGSLTYGPNTAYPGIDHYNRGGPLAL